jgi:hypothetical protein
MGKLTGDYKFKSPYHKNKYLSFNILYRSFDGTYRVFTEEYKGHKRFEVDNYYPESNLTDMINKGILLKTN